MISNTINYKVYIGQARHWVKSGLLASGDIKYIHHGYMERFYQHTQRATGKTSNSNACPKLYNAIRKHGIQNFYITRLGTYPMREINDREEFWIRMFDSVTHGYNTSSTVIAPNSELAAKKVHESWMDPEYRESHSDGYINRKKEPLPLNITLHHREGVMDGYAVCIRRHNKNITHKLFPNTNCSNEEALSRAIRWRDAVLFLLDEHQDPDKVIEILSSTKKKRPLPQCIYPEYQYGILTGYRVTITRQRKKHQKSFYSKQYTLEQNLQLAIQWKEQLLEQLGNNSSASPV